MKVFDACKRVKEEVYFQLVFIVTNCKYEPMILRW